MVLVLASASAQAQALDKVRFGTNWVAEAEHGGFYQALADGTYAKYGLDVDGIVQKVTAFANACPVRGELRYRLLLRP